MTDRRPNMQPQKPILPLLALLVAALAAPGYAQYIQQGNKLIGNQASVAAAGEGSSVALSRDGSTAAIAGNGDSSVWIFARANGTWTQQGPKIAVAGCTGTPAEFPPVSGAVHATQGSEMKSRTFRVDRRATVYSSFRPGISQTAGLTFAWTVAPWAIYNHDSQWVIRH